MKKKTKLLTFALAILFACSGCSILTENASSMLNTDTPHSESNTGDSSSSDKDDKEDKGDSGNTGDSDNTGDGDETGDAGNTDDGGNTGNSGNTGPVNISPINVIMVNDNHGVLYEEDGGMDKIAAGINQYASLGNTVKIANGDMFQGTYLSSTLKGLPMLEALNELDFDAFVMGNHEFDWGLDEMKKYKDGDLSNGEAEFPFLGANIYDKRTGKMVDWLEPYTIVEFDEVKVGIIGIIGYVESSILSVNVEDYDFVAAEEIVKDYATELRSSKDCDVVLVAVHGDDDFLTETMAFNKGDGKVDGIFTGHSHSPTNRRITRGDGSEVCVLQNGGYGDSFARLTINFDENGQIKNTYGNLHETNDFTSDGTLNSVFEKYKEQIAIGETVLTTIDQDISRYDLGIEIVHCMFERYNTAYAVINTGGVRAKLEAGEVTYADVFQVLPFENEVYIVTLTGERLKSYINGTSGIYRWGIYQENIVDDQEYTMAIIDYVYLSDYFKDYRNDSCIDTNERIRDVMIELIKDAAA